MQQTEILNTNNTRLDASSANEMQIFHFTIICIKRKYKGFVYINSKGIEKQNKADKRLNAK